MTKIVIDLDNTICITQNGDYANSIPIIPVVEKLREYKSEGYEIIIHTSRNMRTYQGNIGKIAANTLPIIVEWLNKHKVPYDEIYIGKPWCGQIGFYVDDRYIRPNEFILLSADQIFEIIGK
jgi:capsule biosynthesis phosphatase